jgi:Ca2+-binding RTX toxin-like protein
MSHARPRIGRRSLVLAVVMVLVGAASASATTVTFTGAGVDRTATVTGGDNLRHELQFRITTDGLSDEIYDVQPITGTGCSQDTATKITCPGSGNLKINLGSGNDDVTFVSQGFDCFNAYELNLGEGANMLNLSGDCGPDLTGPAIVNSGAGADVLTAGSQGPMTFNAGGGNDSVYATPGNDVVHGGEGDDRLFGYAGNDQLLAEGGADQLNGGSGNDNLDGGIGDDNLEYCSNCIGSNNDPGVGADNYIGGGGADRLWLDGHAAGMTISIDGQPNDGSSGEGDNVGSDIEEIFGTVHNDVFTGTAGPDNFAGDGGNDEIHGAGGNDDLYGGPDDDQIFGDAGNDKLQGASGADRVDGGSGVDSINGDRASCTFTCSFDADALFARDGEQDSVDCGGGADTAQVDQLDVVAFCTSIDRQGVGVAKPSFTGSKKTVKVNRKGRFSYSFGAGAGLRGKAVFRGMATKSFTVPSSGKVKLNVTLPRKKLALLRRKGTIKSKVTVTLKDTAGQSSVASKTVTYKR